MLTLLPLSDHIHLHTPDHFQPLTAHFHLGTPHILLHNPLVCCMGSLRIPNLLHLQQPGQLLLQLGSLMVQVIISTMMSPTHTLRPQVHGGACSITPEMFAPSLYPFFELNSFIHIDEVKDLQVQELTREPFSFCMGQHCLF